MERLQEAIVRRTPRFFGFPVNFPVLREFAAHKNAGDFPISPLEIASIASMAHGIAIGQRYSALDARRSPQDRASPSMNPCGAPEDR